MSCRKRSLRKTYPKLLLTFMMGITALIVFFNVLNLKNCLMFSDIGSDTTEQYFPIFNMIVDKISSGDFSTWEFNWGLGTDIFNNQSLVFDPFNIIIYSGGVLKGTLGIAYAIGVTQIIKSFLCGYITYFYLSCFNFNELSKVISSYICAFSGFLMLWGQHYFFSTACVILLALILMIEKSFKDKRFFIPLTVVAFFAFSFSVYTSYMMGIACVFYVFVRLSMLYGKNLRKWLEMIGQFVICILIAFLMSAVFMIPSIYQITQVSSRLSGETSLIDILKLTVQHYNPIDILRTIARFFSNNIYGTALNYFGTINYYESQQLFFSSLIFPFSVIFFFEGIVYSKRKPLFIFIFLLFLYSFISPFVASAFNYFSVCATRYSFVFLPLFAVIMAFVISRIKEIHRLSFIIGLISAVFSVMLCINILFFATPDGKNIVTLLSDFDINKHKQCIITISVVLSILIVMTLLTIIRKSKCSIKYKNIMYGLLVIVFMINVLVDTNVTANFRQKITFDNVVDTKITRQGIQKLLEKTDDDNFYRVEKEFSTQPLCNSSLVLNFQGISCYNTTYNKYVQEFYKNIWPKICYEELGEAGKNYISYPKVAGETQLTSLLGIKYIFAKNTSQFDNSDFELLSEDNGIYLLKNKNAAGLGVLFKNTISEKELLKLKTPEERKNALKCAVAIVGNGNSSAITSSTDFDYKQNSVDFIKGKNDSYLYANVNINESKTLFLSLPFDKGWKCYVNGKETEIKRANIGFSAVRLNKGNNKIELKYSTPFLKEGFIITSFGFVSFIIMCIYFLCFKKDNKKVISV